MTVSDLFVGIKYELLQGDMETEVFGLSFHSKKASQKDLFFCIKGAKDNGANYINEVEEKGVSAIVTEENISSLPWMTVIKVCDIRRVMAQISCKFYDNPSKKLITIGITGTKGKTTTAFMIYYLLQSFGERVGMIGTVGVRDLYGTYQTDNTTPESCELQKIMAKMVKQGIAIAVMEVSSQGLKHSRVHGICFDYGIFTNLSKDHIGSGEHETFREYKHYKKQLMRLSKCSIINADDLFANEFMEASERSVTYGYIKKADYQAKHVRLIADNTLYGVSFDLESSGKETQQIKVGMPGLYTIYNALAAIVLCELLVGNRDALYKQLQQLHVTGRMESIAVSNAFSVYIDYAHNAASLKQLLLSMRAYTDKRILLLFGCGGNRSRQRRLSMGKIAGKLADFVVLTNDNPRDENPDDILQDIMEGMKAKTNYSIVKDRKEAIRFILTMAKQGDIVLLAGKGHETYQEVCGERHKMDERGLIREIMEEEDVRTICGYNCRYFD